MLIIGYSNNSWSGSEKQGEKEVEGYPEIVRNA
jgi:hypothetical protein